MRTWSRATVDVFCGLCHTTIPRGAALLRITVPGLTRALLRCGQCFPAPPDLPALVERSSPLAPTPLVRFTPHMLPLDWKARQAGRDPGEEG